MESTNFTTVADIVKLVFTHPPREPGSYNIYVAESPFTDSQHHYVPIFDGNIGNRGKKIVWT